MSLVAGSSFIFCIGKIFSWKYSLSVVNSFHLIYDEQGGEKSCLCCFYCWYFFNSSVLRYILCCKTPRNATGHGKGRSIGIFRWHRSTVFSILLSCGHSSHLIYDEQGEEPCLCSCWYFFNPSVLRPPPLYFVCQQNAGEECRNLSMVSLYCFFSPFVLWVFVPSHLRWAGERSLASVALIAGISLTPSVPTCHLPYILRCKTPRNAMGHGKGRSEMFRMLQGLAGGLFQ